MFAGLLMVFFLFVIILFVPWIIALVDALRVDDRVWDAAHQSKIVWVLVIVFLGLLGAILYFAIAKPALNRVPASIR